MKKKILFVLMAFLIAAPTGIGLCKEFYEGKTIKLIVATKPGGGYDLYGRMLAKYMAKYLPGSKIIVKNRPGAGHIIGCSETYHAKPNGLTFGTFNRSLPLAQLAELPGVKFDLTKMSWLGSPASELYSLVMVKKFKTLDDIRNAPEVTLSSAGVGSQSHVTSELFKNMFNLDNIKVVPGYGGGEAELAMMRGELDGQFGSLSSLTKFVEEGNGNVVLLIGKNKPAEFSDVPLMHEVVKEQKYQPVLKLLNTLNVLARPFAGPPGIPADRLKILRDAFYKSCNDPEFLAFAEKSGVPVDLTTGEEALELVEGIIELDQSLVQLIKNAYGSGEGD
jgi:tripartite-type tricarboxylate transporter receptor subunit TctC